MRISGKTDRAAGGLIQRWLRETGDDCAMISGLLAMAEADRRYDPIAWVEAAIQKRTGKRGQAQPEQQFRNPWLARQAAQAGHAVIDIDDDSFLTPSRPRLI